MSKEWRLLNFGEVPWKRTQSIYHALALVQEELNTPNTLIIIWPDKPFVCIGLHQIIDTSIDISNITSMNLPYIRRACGGGAVYLNKEQIFYQIICRENEYPRGMIDFYKLFLNPVVETYKHFGISAQFVPVNDIVANNRKISGNGAVTYNSSKVLVGNFILDFPAKNMSKILKVPEEKFRDKIASTLEERMGSFRYFLNNIPSKEEIIKEYIANFENKLNIKLIEGELLLEEIDKIKEIDNLYDTDEWLYYVERTGRETYQQKIKSGTYFTSVIKKLPGGLINLFLHFDEDKIKDIIISGDFSLNPPFVLHEIEEGLKGTRIEYDVIRIKLGLLLEENNVEMPGIQREELAKLIVEAFENLKK
ncbi:MAG: lipoate--protein ligase [Candidatus Heimdallarchaeaceae archaeon]